jgi:seryl-tRNA(Sec) selenium transferase
MLESYTIYAEIISQNIAFPFPELICIASCKFLPYKNSLKKTTSSTEQVVNEKFSLWRET